MKYILFVSLSLTWLLFSLKFPGKKFSLPAPKGGKHAVNPVLCDADAFNRRRGHQITKMARNKTNAMDPDYVAGEKLKCSIGNLIRKLSKGSYLASHGGFKDTPQRVCINIYKMENKALIIVWIYTIVCEVVCGVTTLSLIR